MNARLVATAFRRAEQTMTHRPGVDRDTAIVEYVLAWLADPCDPYATETVEDIDRKRASREVTA